MQADIKEIQTTTTQLLGYISELLSQGVRNISISQPDAYKDEWRIQYEKKDVQVSKNVV